MEVKKVVFSSSMGRESGFLSAFFFIRKEAGSSPYDALEPRRHPFLSFLYLQSSYNTVTPIAQPFYPANYTINCNNVLKTLQLHNYNFIKVRQVVKLKVLRACNITLSGGAYSKAVGSSGRLIGSTESFIITAEVNNVLRKAEALL